MVQPLGGMPLGMAGGGGALGMAMANGSLGMLGQHHAQQVRRATALPCRPPWPARCAASLRSDDLAEARPSGWPALRRPPPAPMESPLPAGRHAPYT
jgi:hypothetical protein